MSLERKTGLQSWSGDLGVYYQSERPSVPFPSQKAWDDHLFRVAVLNYLATSTHSSTTKPNANNDSADTAGVGRPFRTNCLWYNSTDNGLYICTGHSAGAATWRDIGGIAANNSSSSSSSSNSSSSNSSSNSSSSSTVAGNTSSSSNSSSSDSTMSSSSTSSSESSNSSSSTVAGNTSSSCSSQSSSSSSSSTVAGNTSSSSSSP